MIEPREKYGNRSMVSYKIEIMTEKEKVNRDNVAKTEIEINNKKDKANNLISIKKSNKLKAVEVELHKINGVKVKAFINKIEMLNLLMNTVLDLVKMFSIISFNRDQIENKIETEKEVILIIDSHKKQVSKIKIF